MEIRNVTTLSKEINREFQKVHFKKRGMPFIVVFNLIILALAILMFVCDDFELGAYFIFIIIIFDLAMVLITLLATRIMNKSYKILQESPVEAYTFTDDEVKVETRSASTSSTSTFKYSVIHSVLLAKNFVALYINKMQALVIDNNGYVSGTREELIELFKTKLDAKKIKK